MQRSTSGTGENVLIHTLQPDGSDTCFKWRLAYYAPGSNMPMHWHEEAHFSVLLAGQARERSSHGEFESKPFLMELKPAGYRHANQFGPDGALLLSVTIRTEGTMPENALPVHQWRLRCGQRLRREWQFMARSIASFDDSLVDELEAVTVDLLSIFLDCDDDRSQKVPPTWLIRAREAVIESDDSVCSIARAAGVHRVHLARSFKYHFLQSITQCRRNVRLARAVRLLVRDAATTGAASLDAGFSDQPHLTRIMRQQLGITPGILRSTFAV